MTARAFQVILECRMPHSPTPHNFRYLTRDGDGTTRAATFADSALSPGFYYIDTDEPYLVSRLITLLVDGQNFSAGGYGSGPELANGIQLQLVEKANPLVVVKDFFDGIPVKTNADWSGKGAVVDYYSFGQGDNYLRADWNCADSGLPVVVAPDLQFQIVILDDLTGLTRHEFHIMGYLPDRVTFDDRNWVDLFR